MFGKRDHANPMAETVREFRRLAPRMEQGEADAWPPTDAFRTGPAADVPAAAPAAPAGASATEPAPEARTPAPPPDELAEARAARDLLNRLAVENRIALRYVDPAGDLRAVEGELVLCRLVPRVEYDEVPLA